MRKNTVQPNTLAFENEILIHESGFREYDARWLYPKQLNLRGINVLGQAIATMIKKRGIEPEIVVGHDYRSYSNTIKQALIVGLMAGGCRVHDIGLALSPMAYYAQFELDCPAVAMVTASHNENGWTGVKMGMDRPLTFGPDEMQELKETVMNKSYELSEGGAYSYHRDLRNRYMQDLIGKHTMKRKLKVVTACGNGTAGIFAPTVLEKMGCDVIQLDCEPDYTFPNHNPNPEDMAMLESLSEKVLEVGADIGFAFDGDGDRCGVVDNKGHEIFADKIGVLLARYLSREYDNNQFVCDVKSTGLYKEDPVLKDQGVKTDYWITGHSYIKRRVNDINALAGFEKSGHYFFNAPIGHGYDDGILSAIMICKMMDHFKNKSLHQIETSLPKTWASPTMSPFCPDENKYDVVNKITDYYKIKKQNNEQIFGQKIAEIITVNGVRIVLEDGTWGLIRASSNKPCLVVVVESPSSEVAMHAMFNEIDQVIEGFDEVGDYDQKINVA
ncbi:MAG: phosphomannomutase/phosphoglucomutase [Alphaproteobacteria bacterium]